MFLHALTTTALILTLATPALAGSKVIVSPRLSPPRMGSFFCTLVNASEKRDLNATVSIYTNLGLVIVGPEFKSLTPLRSTRTTYDSGPAHCVVRVESGSLKDARVLVGVLDANGVPTVAVNVPPK